MTSKNQGQVNKILNLCKEKQKKKKRFYFNKTYIEVNKR